MPSRRTHSKSRHGCIECKARKVKCDEIRPSCIRCTTRKNECHYSSSFRGNPSNVPPSASPSPLSSVTTPSNHESPIDLLKGIFLFPPRPPVEPAYSDHEKRNNNFSDGDLELLHHYSTSTYLTLASDAPHENLWQTVIPQMAFSNAFLLHGLLAISACHLAHLRPELYSQYITQALHHYTSAVGLFRPLLDNIHGENATRILAFSALFACLSFAMPQVSTPEPAQPSTVKSYIENILAIFRMVRGLKAVLVSARPWIEGSPVATLIAIDIEGCVAPLESDAEVAMKSLEVRIYSDAESQSLKTAYLDAVEHLRAWNPHESLGAKKQSLILAWPVLISDRFLTALVERRPIAVAILGFYGTVLHILSPVWWTKDKGRLLVDAVSKILSREWETVMIWARMRVGLPCDSHNSNNIQT